MKVDRDFAFLLNAYDIDPGSLHAQGQHHARLQPVDLQQPRVPRHRSDGGAQGDRVRIRVGNLTMTNHPIHLHGHMSSRSPAPMAAGAAVGALAGSDDRCRVGQMRAIEFIATEPGDWAFHCHKSHHTMNAMGHDVPTMIGVDQRGIAEKINKLVPDYMVMGDKGGSMAAWKCRCRTTPADDDGARPVRRHRHGRHVHDRQGAQALHASIQV
jgi:hypothetical protein